MRHCDEPPAVVWKQGARGKAMRIDPNQLQPIDCVCDPVRIDGAVIIDVIAAPPPACGGDCPAGDSQAVVTPWPASTSHSRSPSKDAP